MFFFTENVGAWNTLSEVMVQADIIAAFKRLLDREIDIDQVRHKHCGPKTPFLS